MVSSKPYKKQHVTAGSLIESVVSISIIVICLLAAFRFYFGITSSTSYDREFRLQNHVSSMVSEIKMNDGFNDDVYDFEDYKILKKVSNHNGNNRLKKVTYMASRERDTVVFNYLVLKYE